MIWNDFSAEYVAIISVQAAMIETVKTPAPLKPPLPNCPQCKGSGQVRTGDNQNWTNCPCTERSDSKKP
jgi:hypothetical protein